MVNCRGARARHFFVRGIVGSGGRTKNIWTRDLYNLYEVDMMGVTFSVGGAQSR